MFVISFNFPLNNRAAVLYEGRSWTKCSTRRFVMAFRRFGIQILLVDSLFPDVDSANCQFDSSASLVRRFVMSFRLVDPERL